MNKDGLILAINPGSTSTKIGVYAAAPPDDGLREGGQGLKEILEKTIRHSVEELEPYKTITDQFDFRKDAVLRTLKEGGIDIQTITIIMGRGGLIKPVKSGIIKINEALIRDLKASIKGVHASNLGGLIAHEIAMSLPNAEAYTVDPVVVDELQDVARISGHPRFERISIFHALNQKATARMHAEKMRRAYEELNLIVVHLGGGISVGAHRKGLVVDVNQALDGEGPFSPERSGTLPSGALAALCFSGGCGQEEVKKMILGKGGYVAYLGTNSAAEVEERAASGDGKAKLIRDALVYQVAKEVGAMAVVLEGKIDAILLTGGIAFSKTFTADLQGKISFLAPVYVYPGENEIFALAYNGNRILQGKAEIQDYA
jgi:butyrate kinase